MAIGKTPTTMINSVTVAAGGVQDSSSSLDIGGAIALDIGFTMTFNASAGTNGARIELYGDPTGANSSFSIGTDDEVIDSYTIIGKAGKTVSNVVRLLNGGKYVKFRVVNLSGSYSITGCTITAMPQTA